MLDADEALDDVLRDAILAASAARDAYRVRRTTYFCGKPMRIWRDEPLLRLFRSERVTLNAHPAAAGFAPVHEAWACDRDVGELAGMLLHYSYPDVATYRRKYDLYTDIEAKNIAGAAFALLSGCVASIPRLAWLLLARGALLDGPRGWYVAYRSAVYPAVAARKALFR